MQSVFANTSSNEMRKETFRKARTVCQLVALQQLKLHKPFRMTFRSSNPTSHTPGKSSNHVGCNRVPLQLTLFSFFPNRSLDFGAHMSWRFGDSMAQQCLVHSRPSMAFHDRPTSAKFQHLGHVFFSPCQKTKKCVI